MARILPNNATPLERGFESVASEVLKVPVEFHKLWNPDLCPPSHLHILAATFAVEVWKTEWPVEMKRAVIKATPKIKRHKGTRLALETAIGSLNMGATIHEWFEYSAAPYFFKVSLRVFEQPFTQSDAKILFDTAIEAKNVRSFLEKVEVKRAVSGQVFIGTATRSRMTLRHSYEPFTYLGQRAPAFVGCGYFSRQKMRLQ